MFSLNIWPMSFLPLSTWIKNWQISKGEHSKPFLLFEFFCGTPPSCLKVKGGGPQDFIVRPRPLGPNWVFVLIRTCLGLGLGGMGTKGLGPGLDNYSLRIIISKLFLILSEHKELCALINPKIKKWSWAQLCYNCSHSQSLEKTRPVCRRHPITHFSLEKLGKQRSYLGQGFLGKV